MNYKEVLDQKRTTDDRQKNTSQALVRGSQDLKYYMVLNIILNGFNY